MLEQEEITELLTRAKSGDEQAKTRLIEENSPLIKSVIRRYKNKGVEYDDLYQLGCIGFLKAIRNFSAEFGVKFSTYAVPMIAGEVKRFLRDDGFVKVSRSTKALAIKISYFVEKYKNEHCASPNIETIAAAFGIEPQEIVFIMDSSKFPVSIYEKSEDDERPLLEKLAVKEDPDEDVDRMMLKELISELNERERKIVLLRYFKDKTQSEVARVLNVSQVQVSRLESKIIEKMRVGFEVK